MIGTALSMSCLKTLSLVGNVYEPRHKISALNMYDKNNRDAE